MKHEESQAQEAVVRWLQMQYSKVLFTGGFAGEKLRPQQAIRRKKMGYRAGSPDLLILAKRLDYGALLVEMKAMKGTISPAQREFHAAATANGYKVIICYGFESARLQIQDYLEIK